MIYFYNLTQVDNNIYKINSTHYYPFDSVYGLNKTAEELEQNGILLDGSYEDYPDIKYQEDKVYVLRYINIKTKEVVYEEVVIKEEETPEVKINKRLEKVEEAINELILGGM